MVAENFGVVESQITNATVPNVFGSAFDRDAIPAIFLSDPEVVPIVHQRNQYILFELAFHCASHSSLARSVTLGGVSTASKRHDKV
jgi:hypothetical protein